jgi:outer membrane protein TolC
MTPRWSSVFWAAAALAAGISATLAADRNDLGKPLRGPSGRLRLITLEQAYDLALASDQAIRNAYIELRSARLEPWSALTRMGPRLTGNLSYEVIRERRFTSGPATTALDETLVAPDLPPRPGAASPGRLTAPGVSGPTADPALGAVGASAPLGASDFDGTHSYTRRAGLTLQQPLLDLTVFPAWRFGRLSAESARLRRRFIIRETLFGVAQAYYAVLKLQAIVGVNRETVALAGEQIDVAKYRLSLGDVARTDVLRAESVYHAARRTLIESAGLLKIHRNTLANILNLDWEADFVVVNPREAAPEREPFRTFLQRGFERREDYRASALGIGQRVERRKEVAASYAPRIVAQANHDWDSVTTNTSDTNAQRIWSGFVAVEVPFFTGGQREIDLSRAGLALDQARLDHEKLAKAIEAEMLRGYIDAGTLRESIIALEAEAAAVQQSYEDLTTNYGAGTATSLDVSAGLLDRNNARTSLLGSRYDYQVALRNLARAEADFQEDRIRATRVK